VEGISRVRLLNHGQPAPYYQLLRPESPCRLGQRRQLQHNVATFTGIALSDQRRHAGTTGNKAVAPFAFGWPQPEFHFMGSQFQLMVQTTEEPCA
jgi:hypothetical protein